MSSEDDEHVGAAGGDGSQEGLEDAGVAEVEYTEDDIVNILVSTDNHIGFMERDPVRGNDSFAAFEEVLATARDRKVDLVLLAGDLFHENKPSRYTLYRTMEILRKYVMGYNPVRVQIVSDQALHFGGAATTSASGHAHAPTHARVRTFNRVNWEDPHYNIDLPIFSIHGNHDDPAREGDEVLAALDLLSMANLVNYFGKADSADSVTLAPILLVKNKTRVALYGLGSMRDDRFARMLADNNVKFRRPAERPEDWFSVFLIHQNRDNRGLRTRMGNTGAEACLPRFLDLVIWGHEHECFTEPVKAGHPDAETFVLQPGSTVATSLSEGESRPKHSFLLQVRGSKFRVLALPLRHVRPFILRDIELAAHVNHDAPDADVRVANLLRETVAAMIDEIENELQSRPEDLLPPASMLRPLVRLKVEHSGFNLFSNQRFGSVFAERVANPADILLFWRKHATRTRAKPAAESAGDAQIMPPQLPADLGVQRLEDIVMEQLKAQKLALLEDDVLNRSLKKFVEGDSGAIRDAIDDLIKAQQEAAKRKRVATRDELMQLLETERAASAAATHDADEEDREIAAETANRVFSAQVSPPTANNAGGSRTARARAATQEAAKRATAGAAGRPRSNRNEDEEAEFNEDDEAGIGIANDDEDLMVAPVKRTAPAAPIRGGGDGDDDGVDDNDDLVDTSRLPRRAGAAARSSAAGRRARAVRDEDDYEEDDRDEEEAGDEDDGYVAPSRRGRGATARGGRGGRAAGAAAAPKAAAGSKRARAPVDDDIVDLSQDDADRAVAARPTGTARGGAARGASAAATKRPRGAAAAATPASTTSASRSSSSARRLPW